MAESYRCLKEGDLSEMQSEIRVLNQIVKEDGKNISRLKDSYDSMNKIDTAISVMSVSLDHIVEHNKRQDERQEKQDIVVANQNETLVNINQNLSELNKGQASLDNKVESLEERVDASERRSTINITEVQRDNYLAHAKDYFIPGVTGAAIMATILQIIKIIKG